MGEALAAGRWRRKLRDHNFCLEAKQSGELAVGRAVYSQSLPLAMCFL